MSGGEEGSKQHKIHTQAVRDGNDIVQVESERSGRVLNSGRVDCRISDARLQI